MILLYYLNINILELNIDIVSSSCGYIQRLLKYGSLAPLTDMSQHVRLEETPLRVTPCYHPMKGELIKLLKR